MVAANSIVLEAQLEERPLAKKQEALLDDAAKSTEAEIAPKAEDVKLDKGKGKEKTGSEAQPPEKEKAVKNALLKNDDVELQRVSKVFLIPP